MTVVDLFPDAEALISKVVRDGLSARVYSSIPSTPTYPLIIVKRLGGIPMERTRLDVAELQFDVWGTTKSEARLLAAQTRQAVFTAEGTTYTIAGGWPTDAFVTAIEDSLGMQWLPDLLNKVKDRYVFGLRVFLHDAS